MLYNTAMRQFLEAISAAGMTQSAQENSDAVQTTHASLGLLLLIGTTALGVAMLSPVSPAEDVGISHGC